MLKEPEETLCLSTEVSMALISICARPAPNMGGDCSDQLRLGLRPEHCLQTVLRELSIDEEKLRNIRQPKREIMR